MNNQKNSLFISYSSKDKSFVSRLASELTTYGVKVWWDMWEMKVGDSINNKIQEGISSAAWLAIVLSPNSVNSSWVKKEINAALVKELGKHDVFILPILYKDCEIPLFLKDKVYADFRNSSKDGLNTLLDRFVPRIDPKICERLLSEKETEIKIAYLDIPDIRENEYIDWLLGKLSGSSSHERRASLMALFVIRYKHLPSHLIAMARDPIKSNRRLAAFYLGELRVKTSIGIISELMSDGSPDVRATARDAYRKINK